jgi:hypothetical protein
MTRMGAIMILLVALALGGMGYQAYLKQHPGAQRSAAEEWASSEQARKLLPGLFFAALGVGVVAVGVGGYRHHWRGNRVWSDFAARLGMPCQNAAFFGDDPSRVVGDVEGRAFLLETRVVRIRGAGGQRDSSTHTEMKLRLAGAPDNLALSSRSAVGGSGFLGRMAQGVADKMVEARGLGRYEVRTGDVRFDEATRAFCPDQEAALAWVGPRTGTLLEYLRHQSYTLEKGFLVHTSPNKTSSHEQLGTQLARLKSFAKKLEVVAI